MKEHHKPQFGNAHSFISARAMLRTMAGLLLLGLVFLLSACSTTPIQPAQPIPKDVQPPQALLRDCKLSAKLPDPAYYSQLTADQREQILFGIMVDTIADFKKCATDKPALRKWYQDRDTDIKQLNAQK
jgi:hypothetical protein